MKYSDQLDLFASAFAKAQATYKPLIASSHANIQTKAGGSFSFDYSELPDIVNSVREALTSNGISIIQFVESDKSNLEIISMLLHASGQFITSNFIAALPMGDSRETSIKIAFVKRWALTAMLGVTADSEPAPGGNAGQRKAPPFRPPPVISQPAKNGSVSPAASAEDKTEVAPADDNPVAALPTVTPESIKAFLDTKPTKLDWRALNAQVVVLANARSLGAAVKQHSIAGKGLSLADMKLHTEDLLGACIAEDMSRALEDAASVPVN